MFLPDDFSFPFSWDTYSGVTRTKFISILQTFISVLALFHVQFTIHTSVLGHRLNYSSFRQGGTGDDLSVPFSRPWLVPWNTWK